MILQVLIGCVIAFGLSYVIGQAKISQPIRYWFWTYGWMRGVCSKCGAALRGDISPSDAERAEQGQKALGTHAPLCYGAINGALHFPLRWIVNLVECPACSGFHMGFISSFWIPPLIPVTPWIWPITLGLFVCGSNLILGRLVGTIGPIHPIPIQISNAVPPQAQEKSDG